jgi:hypothetical protein
MYGIRISGNLLPSGGFVGWFDMIYLGLAGVAIGLLVLHLRRRIPFIPESWMGKGQLMYIAFLWAVVGINFVHVLPRFTPQRLVTEWVITVNAMACTVLVVIGSVSTRAREAARIDQSYGGLIRRAVALGAVAAIVVTFAGWGIKRAMYGDQTAGGIPNQIRFGTNNTNTIK